MQVSLFAPIVLLWGFITDRVGVLRMQILVMVLGGTAALVLPGGATIVVPAFALPFLVARAYSEAVATRRHALASAATFALGLSVAWGIVLAIYMPRALQGELLVMALARDESGLVRELVGLRPVSGNLTQSVYALGSVAAFASVRVLVNTPARMRVLLRSVTTLALIDAGAGVLNVVEFYSHMPSMLDFFRTAYAVTHQDFGGLPRIQGTFPETSAFSSFSIGLFAFVFQLWLDGYDARRTGLASGLLLLCLLLSTSGTAYGALVIYGFILLFALFRRAAAGDSMSRLAWVIAGLLLAWSVLGLLVVLEAPIVDGISAVLDRAVFGKLESDSGTERSAWNAQGLRNFLETYGVGLGFGTVRTSSFAVTLLSNLGVVGTATYCVFLWHVLRPKVAHGELEPMYTRAARHAVIAGLCAACLSATVFDLGVDFYLFAAVASLDPRLLEGARDTATDVAT